MRPSRHRLWIATLALSLAIAGGTPAAASFDFLFSATHVSNDDELFLNLTVSNYGYPRTVVEPVLPRLVYVEQDLPVVLFLARESGRSVQFIVDLRSRGLSWSVIFGQVGVPMDVLFVGIERDPGPPYGKAWGHWKNNPRQVRLSDADVQGLVRVQVGGRIARVPTYDLARGGGSGKSVATQVADRKGRPHESAHASKGKPPSQKGGKPNGNRGKGGGGHH